MLTAQMWDELSMADPYGYEPMEDRRYGYDFYVDDDIDEDEYYEYLMEKERLSEER